MITIINIYSTKNINFISTIISIFALLILNLFIFNFSKPNLPEKNKEQIISKNSIKEKKTEKDSETGETVEKIDWYIEIPSINLKAPIKETTQMHILNQYVGHFEDTAKTEGNIGLAGHNRGYEKNYFEKLKQLNKGEKIKYKYYDFKKTYIIDKIETIKETNWDNLENTKENKITLITCIENKPKYRLCIQGTEENRIINKLQE